MKLILQLISAVAAIASFPSRFLILTTLVICLGSLASAAPTEATLTLPFFNPETAALPATILGVDAQGRTTYALNQDEMQGSSTLAKVTGTLVAAADYASYTLSADVPGIEIEFGFDCALNSGAAVCTGLDESSVAATTTASSLQPIVIDVLATAAPFGRSNSAGRLPVPIFGALLGLVLAYVALVLNFA
ncbi:hypothetical protein C8R46DRAFT_1296348 [Mycena filopes]|nr:hypothetical protein C8R46DRAFT_1296348 [Mycena filopes]